ncbi:hypothetical protein DVH24_008463 [Malus domestica]|uniref:Uncharacterized protein n=1 Tax=Malus domestica TaxID=3750 RepID=A0A498JQ13_MALDO|nr:hypothetical protein DVH24_008463 [Malus domestica]
MGDLLGSCS